MSTRADSGDRSHDERFVERNFDVAQFAHLELLTPTPQETLWFFHDLLGMEESAREGQSVYLRGFEDHYHHTLKVTEAPEPGLGHFALRTSSPQALRRRVAALEAAGAGQGWAQEETGHGPAFRFRTPDGHRGELLWEVEYFHAPDGQESVIHSRPQKRPLRGVPVRRLDHMNLMAADVPATKDFLIEQLGFRETENIIFTDGTYVGAWLSVSNLTHELSVMMDQTGARGRFHHVCFWYGSPQHVADAAEHFREHGITLETAPGKHGVTQGHFLYVIEPGGNRVELFGDVGYLIFDPTWRTRTWNEHEMAVIQDVYGGSLPAEYFAYGTPPVQTPADAETVTTRPARLEV